MNQLTKALDMDAAEIAHELSVTTRTVRAWIAGVRRPREHNRAALAALVSAAHIAHSAATHRWSAARDRALCATEVDLMTAPQCAQWEAERAEMQELYARARAEFARQELAAQEAARAEREKSERSSVFERQMALFAYTH